MMMIDKVKKYLLRHSEIERYNKNESGSEYFKVGSSKIRVSDHLATSLSDPTTLNIIVNGEQFVVFYGNKLININDYEEFKKFLKYHIQMCGCFKSLIKKATEAMKKTAQPVQVHQDVQPITPGQQTLLFKGEEIDVSDIPAHRLPGVQSMIAHGCFPRKDSLLKHLAQFRNK